jgi:hypothetical protein
LSYFENSEDDDSEDSKDSKGSESSEKSETEADGGRKNAETEKERPSSESADGKNPRAGSENGEIDGTESQT